MRKLRKGDEVIVLVGRDKGKRGVVQKVMQGLGKVIVENINLVKIHTKANPAKGVAGGIVDKEMPLHISNIAIWNQITGKPDKVGVRILEDGQKKRCFKSNNEVIDL